MIRAQSVLQSLERVGIPAVGVGVLLPIGEGPTDVAALRRCGEFAIAMRIDEPPSTAKEERANTSTVQSHARPRRGRPRALGKRHERRERDGDDHSQRDANAHGPRTPIMLSANVSEWLALATAESGRFVVAPS